MQRIQVLQIADNGPTTDSVTPETIAEEAKRRIGNLDREHFVAFHLDARNRVRSFETVAIGSMVAAIVHPREVFKGAILANAAGIILAHNHPSGDTGPSPEDIAITKRLHEAGRILGIDVLDHIIVGDGTFSLQANGMMP